MKESILNRLEKCEVCGVTYLPENDVCKCPQEEPQVTEWEDAYKQLQWYDKLTELDYANFS